MMGSQAISASRGPGDRLAAGSLPAAGEPGLPLVLYNGIQTRELKKIFSGIRAQGIREKATDLACFGSTFSGHFPE